MKQVFVISARSSADEDMTPIAVIEENTLDVIDAIVAAYLTNLGYSRATEGQWFVEVIDSLWWDDMYDDSDGDSQIRIVMSEVNAY
jgi:hypothetical protein